MGYRTENLAMDKPTFIAKIQVYFFLVPYFKLCASLFKNTQFALFFYTVTIFFTTNHRERNL